VLVLSFSANCLLVLTWVFSLADSVADMTRQRDEATARRAAQAEAEKKAVSSAFGISVTALKKRMSVDHGQPAHIQQQQAQQQAQAQAQASPRKAEAGVELKRSSTGSAGAAAAGASASAGPAAAASPAGAASPAPAAAAPAAASAQPVAS
jgi:hypothetical protein